MFIIYIFFALDSHKFLANLSVTMATRSCFMCFLSMAAFACVVDYYFSLESLWVQFRHVYAFRGNTSETSSIASAPLTAGLNLPSFEPGETLPCLKFIHLPKNAGSKIALAARRHTIPWSEFDTNLTCHKKKRCLDHGVIRWCCHPQRNPELHCSLWHMPPSEDSLIAESYSRCKTFCVVRHPFSRFISEFKWHMQYWSPGKNNQRPGGRPDSKTICSHEVFANYTEEVMKQDVMNFTDDCHRIPQSKYVISDDQQRFYCNHVLHFENLTSEFNALMKVYQLPLRLDENRYNAVNAGCQIELSEELKSWIYEHYRLDFELFGYRFDV